ncbi:MAG: beta propeller repeat protein [Bacilli bacterium]
MKRAMPTGISFVFGLGIMGISLLTLSGCGTSSVHALADNSNCVASGLADAELFQNATMSTGTSGWSWSETHSTVAIYHSNDGGVQWRTVKTIPVRSGTSIHAFFTTFGTSYANVSWLERIGHQVYLHTLSSTDNGTKWYSGMPLRLPNWAYAISSSYFLNRQKGWALVTSSPALGLMSKMIVRTVNGGMDWHSVFETSRKGPQGEFNGGYPSLMAFRSRSIGWIGIEGRTTAGFLHLMETKSGGASWREIRIAVPKKYDSLYFTPNLVRFFNGGQEGVLIGSGIGMSSPSVTLFRG